MRAGVLAIVAFAAMEPITAFTHRFVMHRFGLVLHRSHHRPTHRGWQRNDMFPLLFAGVVCTGLWLGFHHPALADLVPIGTGITTYGAAYAVVHDVYIHRRLRWFGDTRIPVLERLAAAHAVHHRTGGPPFGMLVPIVRHAPSRAFAHEPSPSDAERTNAILGRHARGSRPSQVPDAP
jgi:beta-carotene 3-hydroxylase